MSTGKVVLGALAGLAIGAIGGILFAPEKGSTTRKQIMDKGDDYVDELKSKFNQLLASFSEKFEMAKKEAENLAEKGKERYNEAKLDVKHVASDIKQIGS